MEDDLNFWEMEDDLHFWEMEDDLNFFKNGRRPQSFGKWKTTSINWKIKNDQI